MVDLAGVPVRRVAAFVAEGRENAFRALYARAGFVPCAPFGDYIEDPNSVFMTRTL